VCGIVGMIFRDPARTGERDRVTAALRSLRHRGPDGEGTLTMPGIAAGSTRLAIVDVAGGAQPIFNETGDVAVLFNGEIYNHAKLRKELESKGHHFRTRCDTEVIAHLYEERGEACVDALEGMFAFVVWDAKKRRALLARDRFGIKPLYLATTKDGLAFASETKAIAAAGWIEPSLDSTAIADYFRFAWVPEPATLWRGVTRLPAGSRLVIDAGVAQPIARYHVHRIGGASLSPSAIDEAVREEARVAVEAQLEADVPVGLFLSGGLDSSILALLARERAPKIICHTVALDAADAHADRESADDERHARLLAQRLGLDLIVHRVSADAVDLLPKLLRHLDDPSADPAILSAFLVARAARSTTKVLLSGMGADELAGGYRRSLAARALTPFYQLPRCARAPIASVSRLVGRVPLASDRLRRGQKALRSLTTDVTDLPEALATWTDPTSLGLSRSPSIQASIAAATELAHPGDPLERETAFDVGAYLPSHNLQYIDKVAMAASVEVRVPFLHEPLAALLLSLPSREKVVKTTTKVALRRAFADALPNEILTRPKASFGAPIRAWLGRDLAPMVGDLLSPASVRARGLFDPKRVAKILDEHRRGVSDRAYTVWALLTLEIWAREVMRP
jgi:asparagine synthase (glutamine-hydrolysing)